MSICCTKKIQVNALGWKIQGKMGWKQDENVMNYVTFILVLSKSWDQGKKNIPLKDLISTLKMKTNTI